MPCLMPPEACFRSGCQEFLLKNGSNASFWRNFATFTARLQTNVHVDHIARHVAFCGDYGANPPQPTTRAFVLIDPKMDPERA